MNKEKGPGEIAFKLATAAVLAAIVCVATLIFTIPIPATTGYFNLGETTIYVAALLFGSFVGGFAGGVGAAIADMLVAPQFAIGTLITKSCEGIIVGFLNQKLIAKTGKAYAAAIVAIIVGGLEMVFGYLIYEQLVLNYSLVIAAGEAPFNVVQMLVGLVVAVPIVAIIIRFFPQLNRTKVS